MCKNDPVSAYMGKIPQKILSARNFSRASSSYNVVVVVVVGGGVGVGVFCSTMYCTAVTAP